MFAHCVQKSRGIHVETVGDLGKEEADEAVVRAHKSKRSQKPWSAPRFLPMSAYAGTPMLAMSEAY